ncbi:MAG: hypothetical protein Q7R47_02855 [Candidatus Diapherotrites archaeon]|nr:hypothetical protein [Candidatus Diapherotrites archaeon]
MKFGIRGDHAQVKALKPAEQRRFGFPIHPQIVKRVSKVPLSSKYSAAMILAHILYPGRFSQLVASGLDKGKRTTFSVAVDLEPKSMRAIKAYYRNKKFPSKRLEKKYRAHQFDADSASKQISRDMYAESGILPNPTAMNVGFLRNKKLVFFEIDRINLEMLEERISALSGEQKKISLVLLTELIKGIDRNDKPPIIYVHQ